MVGSRSSTPHLVQLNTGANCETSVGVRDGVWTGECDGVGDSEVVGLALASADRNNAGPSTSSGSVLITNLAGDVAGTSGAGESVVSRL